jgi:hypothetical protein
MKLFLKKGERDNSDQIARSEKSLRSMDKKHPVYEDNLRKDVTLLNDEDDDEPIYEDDEYDQIKPD